MVGGAERYLEQSIAALHATGIPVAFLAGSDEPHERPALRTPPGVPAWTAGPDSLVAVRAWRPTLVLDHHLGDTSTLDQLAALAPVVLVTHNYVGTCISGEKTHKSITPRTCARTLGVPCLLHYYPNRCGGWDPRTMMAGWRLNRARLERVKAAAGVLALSTHMAREYVRHGIAAERVEVVPPPVTPVETVADAPGERAPWRIIFVGRFDVLKGTALLLEALPLLARSLRRPVSLTLVGDGPDRGRVAERARVLVRDERSLAVRITGWLGREAVERELAAHHVLALPSVWPEPFGLVGLEAAAAGLPTVAFDVGGIPDWLRDGVGGVLIRERPRTAGAFANGLRRAIADTATWRRLSHGAREVAGEYSESRFARALTDAIGRLAVR